MSKLTVHRVKLKVVILHTEAGRILVGKKKQQQQILGGFGNKNKHKLYIHCISKDDK